MSEANASRKQPIIQKNEVVCAKGYLVGTLTPVMVNIIHFLSNLTKERNLWEKLSVGDILVSLIEWKDLP